MSLNNDKFCGTPTTIISQKDKASSKKRSLVLCLLRSEIIKLQTNTVIVVLQISNYRLQIVNFLPAYTNFIIPYWVCTLSLLSLISLEIFFAKSFSIPCLMVTIWRTLPPAAASTLPYSRLSIGT